MPQTTTSANLKFTNHWIGIYDPRGPNLIPSRRAARDLQPVPSAKEDSEDGMIIPASPATLLPVYEAALAEKEREMGPDNQQVAQAAANLGLFLLNIGHLAEAEAPLRRAVSIDERNANAAVDADRESLALVLEAQDKRDEAFNLFKRSATGGNSQVKALSLAKLAGMDVEHAASYYRDAIEAEEKTSGASSPRVAVLLQAYALVLRAQHREPEAESILRRALAIELAAPKADPQVIIAVLNALGNLLEGLRQLDEAEKLERTALSLSEQKFGPESLSLALTCTNLADVLWTKKNLREAGLLYRRAIGVDFSIYGPDRPETAADVANLGMLMSESGQSAAGQALLEQALAIYEKTLGPNSDQARFVRERLANSRR